MESMMTVNNMPDAHDDGTPIVTSARPKVSIIVPIYGVELYLRDCVRTLRAQTLRDIEIILVDDGSPDGCPQICDEIAAEDERVRVIHKPNGGLSDARNAGIDVARGEYLGFVDPDDWVREDMYEYLYDGAREYDADVVVCEYFNVSEKNAEATYRPAVRRFAGSMALRALLLLKVGNYAWNKIYRRSLWEDGVRYPVGKKYEDVQTTYRLFEEANLVVALPEAKYYYRRHEQSITGQKTVENDGQCVQSRIVRFEALEQRVEAWPDVRDFMLKEILAYAKQFRDTVGRRPQAEFDASPDLVRQVSSFLARHRDEYVALNGWGRLGRMAFDGMTREDRASWVRSIKVSGLIAKKAELDEQRRRRKSDATQKSAQRHTYYDAYYEEYRSLPIDQNVAFVESRGGEDLAGNMYCIASDLCRRGMRVQLSVARGSEGKVDAILGSGAFPGLTKVEKDTEAYFRAIATAKYLFNDMVYPDVVVKRPGQVFVNTWHGTPLKNLEFDVRKERHAMGGGTRGFLQCDYLAVPSMYLADRLLGASQIDQIYRGRIACCGYPRNAVFFDVAEREKVRRAMGVQDKEVFAYMPTWRGTFEGHVDVTGEYATQAILDFFERTLRDNQVMYVKLHNFAVQSVSYDDYRHVRPFDPRFDAYAVLNAADCLITDYSSVFFDYASCGGKVVLFTYDRAEYLRERGLYIDLDELPFPKADTYRQLAGELNLVKSYDDADFLRTYCTFDRPDSTDTLLRLVIDGEDSCAIAKATPNGKRNVLLYDASYYLHDALPEEVEELLTGLDTSEANYYYGFRQWALKRTPKYLQRLPEAIRLYALPENTRMTSREQAEARRGGGRLPASYVERETQRLFFGNPFDEVRVVFPNEYDPYVDLLRQLPNYRS